MFSSFPTTRHSVTLEAKDNNGKDARGTDFKAYGCYSWKESFYLGKTDVEDEDEASDGGGGRVSNTKKLVGDRARDESSSPTRRSDDEKERTISTTKNSSSTSLLPVGEVSKSPRSPKDPFDEETYSVRREALFPIDEEINE